VRTKSIVFGLAVALVFAAAASAAVIRGTDGPDNLNGTASADLIYGRGGNDIIRAHDGSDVVYAGQGNDVVRGGAGNDVIYGGPGNDVTWVGGGADVQSTGDGNDILHALANDNEPDILNCGPGFDVAYVIVHDPARFHGCEQIIRLTPEEAAATAAANDDNG
jgi:Ca2+-binding RTX toxin-like protein